MADELVGSGVPRDKNWIIPNAIDIATFQDPIDFQTAKQRIGLATKRVLGSVKYYGSSVAKCCAG